MKSKNNMEKVENLLKCNDKLIEINDLFKKNKEKLNYYKKVVKDSNDAIVIQNFNGIVNSWNNKLLWTYNNIIDIFVMNTFRT